MPKRRRSYRGTPEKHRKTALIAAKGIRNSLTRARHFTAQGECSRALTALKTAEWASGLYASNINEPGVSGPRGGTVSYRPFRKSGGYGTGQAKAVASAWKKFSAKCLR